jgi:hypothetical protein
MQSKLAATTKRPANKVIKKYECSRCNLTFTNRDNQWYRYLKCDTCVNIQKLDELKIVIENSGYTLLSTEYDTYLDIVCIKHGNSHQSLYNIGKTRFCNKCGILNPTTYTLETITYKIEVTYAHLKLKVIDTEYNGFNKPLRVRCLICNIEFDYNLGGLKIDRGCGKCGRLAAQKKKIIPFDDIKHRVEVEYEHLNLKVVSDNYINTETPITVECLLCHLQFDYKIVNLPQNKACIKCGPSAPGKWCRIPFDDMAVRVGKFGYELVDIEYGEKTMCIIKCKQGHVCKRYIGDIEEGLKCPDCIGSNLLSESICRKYLEYLFDMPFKKTKISWLINDEGNAMEMDGYNEALNLAFEYDGILHVKFVPYFHKTIERFEKYQKDDQVKNRLCAENNVILIRIPHTIKYNKMLSYIKEQCRIYNIPFEDKADISIENLDIYNKFIEERNKLVDDGLEDTIFVRTKDIVNTQEMIDIACKTCQTIKHVGYYDVINKKKTYWCLQCFHDEKTTILQKMVAAKNWTLLGKYNKGKDPMEIVCNTCDFKDTIIPGYYINSKNSIQHNFTKFCINCV